MALQRRKLLAQGLSIGYGLDTIPADSGGSLVGDKIGIHSFMYGFYNAMDFGAKVNGTTDDSAAIQLAIDTAAAAGGGTVYLPAGTYKLSTQNVDSTDGFQQGYNIQLKDNIHLMGAGRGRTILQSGVADANIIYCSRKTNVSVSHLTTDGAGVSNNSDGVKMLGVTRYLVFDVECKAGRGGFQNIGCTEGVLDSCWALNQVDDSFANTSFGFSVGSDARDTTLRKVQLVNCVSVNSQTHGYQFFQNTATTQKYISATNCIADTQGFIGFRLSDSAPILTNCRAFSGLVGLHCVTTNGAQIINFRAEANNQEGIRLSGAQRTKLIGCTAIDNSVSGSGLYNNMLLEDTAGVGCTNNQVIGGTYGNSTVAVGGNYGIGYGTSPLSELNQFVGPEVYNNVAGTIDGLKDNDVYAFASPDELCRVGGLFQLSGVLTPTALSGDVDDYDPPGLATASVLRIGLGGSARSMTGLMGGVSGRVIYIANIDTTASADLTLVHDSGLSGVTSRFYGAGNADVVVRNNGAALAVFDATSNHWRVAAI